MPENIIARRTDVPIEIALNAPIPLNWFSVRGSEQKKHMVAATALNPVVQIAEFVIVFRYSAPTRQ